MPKKRIQQAEQINTVKKSEISTNRMLIVFLLFVISVFLLLSLKSRYDNAPMESFFSLYFFDSMKYVLLFSSCLLIAAAVRGILACRKGTCRRYGQTLSPLFCLGIAAVFFALTAIMAFFYNNAFLFAIVFASVAALLYFIGTTMQRTFFLLSCLNAFTALAIYLVKFFDSPLDLAATIFFSAVTAAYVLLLFYLRKNSGSLGKNRILPRNARYFPFAICGVLSVLLLAAAYFRTDYFISYILITPAVTLLFGILYALKLLK